MSHALATVRHDGRRPSVTPGNTRGLITASPEGATDKTIGTVKRLWPASTNL